jgi:two-component system, chemotaxis family, chemotaxis protein CheY
MKREDLKLMIVDDTAVSRGLITQALDWMQIEGYRTCADGHEAMQSLVQKPVHLVISDYHMPGLDGLGLLEGIRRTKGIERTGFILVTGRADATVVAKGRALGMNNMITKPFSREQMRDCIERVVGPL